MSWKKLITYCSRTERTTPSKSSRSELSLKNGGLLVEKLVRISNGVYNPFCIFTEHELKQATRNYDQDLVCLLDDNYRLFQGVLENRGDVLIKKTNDYEELVEYCIREIAIAAYVSTNMNLVKLIGCCLESKVPIIVFEYVCGNLSNYLQKKQGLIPWSCRVRIATQIADAIAYLHLGKSRPLIHRHVKTENVLLDENLNAKLFDFGLSLEVPEGETSVEALLEGTIGFLAPESVVTKRFNEKTNVFAFGATLIEILTGIEPHDVFIGASDHLTNHVTTPVAESSLMPGEEPKRRDLLMFLKANLIKDGKQNALEASAELAASCVEILPEKRPTIVEVAKNLKRIQNM